jgi:hypothetical protein
VVGYLTGLYAGLEKNGEPLEQIDGAYERFLELWATVEKKADPAARARAAKVVVPRYDLFDTP